MLNVKTFKTIVVQSATKVFAHAHSTFYFFELPPPIFQKIQSQMDLNIYNQNNIWCISLLL